MIHRNYLSTVVKTGRRLIELMNNDDFDIAYDAGRIYSELNQKVQEWVDYETSLYFTIQKESLGMFELMYLATEFELTISLDSLED